MRHSVGVIVQVLTGINGIQKDYLTVTGIGQRLIEK
jgi:hypothetical protein